MMNSMRRVGGSSLVVAPSTASSTVMISNVIHSLTSSMQSFSVSTASNKTNNDVGTNNGGGEFITYLGLNNLSDNPGAIKKKRRVGRGIGSSKGKTSGRGHKGQKARAGGGVSPMFEGGQTPFFKRIPKRGFTNVHKEEMVPINVGTLQDYVDMGRLRVPEKPEDPPITIKDLIDAGMTKSNAVKHGVKLLSKGKDRLTTPLRMEISRASQSAIQAIESVGGEITTVHYNRLALRALLKPHKFDILPKRARPPPKLMTYYTDYNNRGYLSAKIQLRNLQRKLQLQSSLEEQEQEQQPPPSPPSPPTE